MKNTIQSEGWHPHKAPEIHKDVKANLIHDLGEKGYAWIDNFLPESQYLEIKSYIHQLYDEQKMRTGAVGKDADEKILKEVRGDLIKWVDFNLPGSVNKYFLPQLNSLIKFIRRECYIGVNDFECHFTLYPKGSFYKKHIDCFKGNNNRLISFVFYLNENWISEQGGQLRVYDKDVIVDVDPTGGRLVLFLSEEIEHEVLPTFKERLSITGWMLHQNMKIGFINND